MAKHNKTTAEQMQLLESHLRVKKLRKQPDGGAAAAQAAGAYSDGAWKALNMLNEMILEATEKLDFEVVHCDSEERVNLEILKSVREDIVMFNAMAAQAATTMNKAKADVIKFEALLEEAEHQFKVNKETCDTERTDIEQKIVVAESDMGVMQRVVALVDCSDSAASSSAALYQCVNPHTKKTWTELRGDSAKRALAQIKDSKVGKMLAAQNIYLQSKQEPTNKGDFISQMPVPGATTKEALEFDGCKPGGANCPKLRAQMIDLLGDVTDSLQELRQMLKNLNLHCKQTLDDISAQIKNFENVLSETNEKLSSATKDWGTYTGQKTQKNGEEKDVSAEHLDTMTACKTNVENLVSERCALRMIRGELLNMDGLPNNITDCIVGDWMEDECSVPCSGGHQRLTRSVTPGWNGAKCPADAAEQSCSNFRCPVDCIMFEWSEWGSCTALCGGGIKERARGIKIPALTAEAVQCGETSETVQCNVGACSGDCELGDWTHWSEKCSKPCDDGELKRVKPLVKAAFGDGTCPYFYDESRYQTKACNVFNCPAFDVPYDCDAKADVILVYDGSGSLGLAGWESEMKGTELLAKSMSGPNLKLSTLLFSGPIDFWEWIYCIGMVYWTHEHETQESGYGSNTTGEVMDHINEVLGEHKCGMDWLTHFADNKTSADNVLAINQSVFPQGSTLTSAALSEARAELSHGRRDAESIVIVLTDGYPSSSWLTSIEADKLKKVARLIFVPVGEDIADDEMFHSWASFPWEENVVRVKDLAMLNTNSVVSSILSDFCSDITIGNETLFQEIKDLQMTDNFAQR